MAYFDVFKKRSDLIEKVGEDNAYLAWVVALYLEEPDVDALAGVGLTDGSGDRKIDFIYLDRDNRKLVFAQGFYAVKQRDSAPSNKAADLNTAAAWLLSGDLDLVPEKLRATITDCRAALADGEIEAVDLLYVHNLPESVNVARELQTVETQLRKTLGSEEIAVRAVELGTSRIQALFAAKDSHIEVTDSVDFPAYPSFEVSGPKWKAIVSSVSGSWLNTLFLKYGDKLYSANYRGFLGSNKRKKVNSGIRESAEQKPHDFWAFNNGITILTMATKPTKDGGFTLSGISIINGAQTSGTLGTIDTDKHPLNEVKVLCRVIECHDQETIDQIVKFNNTQNAITNWDQFSNDADQKRIEEEFAALGYNYVRKRGFSGEGDQIGIEQVIQPLLAFHGRPLDAVRGKNGLFQQKPLYNNAFENKKARHILLVYALSRAIDNKRLELKDKSNRDDLIEVEQRQLDLLRNLNFKPFLIAVIAGSLETVVGVKTDPATVAFRPDVAKDSTLVELTARWAPVVDTFLSLVTATTDASSFYKGMSEETFLPTLRVQMNALLVASSAPTTHKSFSELIATS